MFFNLKMKPVISYTCQFLLRMDQLGHHTGALSGVLSTMNIQTDLSDVVHEETENLRALAT